MIAFPNAKINLGLQIVRKREDGYHDLSSIFYPLTQLRDVLEIVPSDKLSINISGIEVDGASDNNLCIKAYKLLANKYNIPPVNIYLHKNIPLGAGMGGGSADATFTLKTLNTLFNLDINNRDLSLYAAELGSDCAFFVENKPAYATGRGEVLSEIDLSLKGWHILMIKPNIHISTAQAFSNIKIQHKNIDITDIIKQPVESWKDSLLNDFEHSIFPIHPILSEVKEQLYSLGASYASMTGSGATIFGLFKELPKTNTLFKDCFVYSCFQS